MEQGTFFGQEDRPWRGNPVSIDIDELTCFAEHAGQGVSDAPPRDEPWILRGLQGQFICNNVAEEGGPRGTYTQALSVDEPVAYFVSHVEDGQDSRSYALDDALVGARFGDNQEFKAGLQEERVTRAHLAGTSTGARSSQQGQEVQGFTGASATWSQRSAQEDRATSANSARASNVDVHGYGASQLGTDAQRGCVAPAEASVMGQDHYPLNISNPDLSALGIQAARNFSDAPGDPGQQGDMHHYPLNTSNRDLSDLGIQAGRNFSAPPGDPGGRGEMQAARGCSPVAAVRCPQQGMDAPLCVTPAEVHDGGQAAAQEDRATRANLAAVELSTSSEYFGLPNWCADADQDVPPVPDFLLAGVSPTSRLADAMHLAHQRAWQLHMRLANREERVRRQSCAGPCSGKWCTSLAPTYKLEDAEWRIAARFRMGLPVCPAGCRCCLRSGQTGTCDFLMDTTGIHATLCGKGPDALVAHSALERWIAQTFRNAGWAAVLEQHIVDWNHISRKTGKVVHAVMDIVGSRPDKPTIYADVTVRSPMASRYGEAGTIDRAEREKCTAYPPIHGMQVTPLAFETWGRCSAGTVQFLRQMAADTAARHRDKGWRTTESLVVLLTEASSLLARAVSRRLLRAQTLHKC